MQTWVFTVCNIPRLQMDIILLCSNYISLSSPISESRRVLQESCEFFLKHNSRVQHKKNHYNPGSHKLKVISKSMGTSTGASATGNHGTSAVDNHEAIRGQASFSEVRGLSEASAREQLERGSSTRGSRLGERDRERQPIGQALSGGREGAERRSKKGSSSKVSSCSESFHRVPEGR